jgi:hypothetical protein
MEPRRKDYVQVAAEGQGAPTTSSNRWTFGHVAQVAFMVIIVTWYVIYVAKRCAWWLV